MKITSALAAAAAVAAAGSVGISARRSRRPTVPTITTLGSEAKLMDGNVVQGWTITNLKTSTDVIPHVVNGTLWEATATDQAIDGGATPYRVEPQCARQERGDLPRPVRRRNAAGREPLDARPGPEDHRQGLLRRHGDAPDSVVYNAGGKDLLVWVQPPPQPRQSGGASSGMRGQTRRATPATATPGTPAAGR